MTYYDKNNNELDRGVTSVSNIPSGYNRTFTIEYPDAFTGNYFFDIDHVGFETRDKYVSALDLYLEN